MSTLPVYALAKDLRQAVRGGHPWLFDRALQRTRPAVAPGQLVEVQHRRETLAIAYADPGRPIAARVLDADIGSWSVDDWRSDDWRAAWLRQRARRAAACRVGDPRLAHCNAWRLIHGENDYLPGLVVDLYDATAVVAFDGPGAYALWASRWPHVLDGLRSAGVVIEHVFARPLKTGARPAQSFDSGGLSEPPAVIEVHEHGARFEVDVRRGHKTGLFLDQRDNRQLVRHMAAGARVLDICAYAGMFSVNAALGGAISVTAVDVSAPALASARRNFARNDMDPEGDGDYRFVAADAFEFLASQADAGRRYDLVILDPPSFAPSERARRQALDSYRRLDRLALAIIEPGGWLMTASCSSHVTREDSLRMLNEAAQQSGRRIRVTDVRGAASDHPTLPGFPEGCYLSFVVAAVD